MIQFRMKKSYNRKEIDALLDMFLTMQTELFDAAGCINTNPTLQCKKCPYKNLCRDIQNSVHYLTNTRYSF